MLRFTVLLLGVAASLAYALPVDSENWQLVPDSDGLLHMVNINQRDLTDDQAAPRFVPEQDMVFRLFTRNNPTTPQVLQLHNAGSITASNFNANHPTRILTHGWTSDGTHVMFEVIRDAYFQVGDFNVIAVDWGVGAVTPNYIAARQLVGAVGSTISLLIDQLITGTGANPDNMYLIGFSLGGQVVANAGKAQHGRINTVIALDPAGPLFTVGQEDALSPADGRYVETMMTNAGLLGHSQPLGQANFYPNWGRTQPGCGIDIAGTCAHDRAVDLYAESITSSVMFRSTRCANHDELLNGACTSSGPDAVMGGQPSNYGRGVTGIYFLETNEVAPFARG